METQPEATLVEFVRYNQWANQQLLSACTNLDEGLLTAAIPGAYGSILETFGHLLHAEAGFLKRIHGTGPQPAFKWEDGPSLADVATFATQVLTQTRMLDPVLGSIWSVQGKANRQPVTVRRTFLVEVDDDRVRYGSILAQALRSLLVPSSDNVAIGNERTM